MVHLFCARALPTKPGPHPANSPGMCLSHIYGESRSLGTKFFTYYDRARPVLPYGTFVLGSRSSNQTRTPPGHPTRHVFIPHLRESRFLGTKFFTYSDRARPVLPYGTFVLGSRASNQTRSPPCHPSRHVLIPYLRGEQVPWDQIFYIL